MVLHADAIKYSYRVFKRGLTSLTQVLLIDLDLIDTTSLDLGSAMYHGLPCLSVAFKLSSGIPDT